MFGARLLEAKDSLAKASTPEPFSASRTSNWIARLGGLPPYIQHIAHDIMEKRGKSESNAIQIAIGVVKRWAKGVGNVDAGTRAAAAKAVAQWMKLRAENAAKKVGKAAAAVAEAELAEWLAEADLDAGDLDADDPQLTPELAKAANRLLAGFTDDDLETLYGEGSSYLQELIAATGEGRNMQEEDLTGRIAESWVEEDWSDRARIAAAQARHLQRLGHHTGFDGRGVAVIPAGRINPHGGVGAPHSDFADRQHTILETETGGRQSISGGWDIQVGHKVDLVHDQTRRSMGRGLRVVGIRHADGRVEGEVPNKSIPHKALK